MAPRIAFVGAGSIGSTVGGLLSKACHDITLIDQWPEHVEAIKRDGLRLSGTVGDITVSARAIHIHEVQAENEPFDVVFVTTKSYDTEWAATLMLRRVSPDARFVSLQNGINDDRLASVVGRNRTLGCVTTISTGLYEPGHAVRTDSLESGSFKTGEIDGSDTPRVREIVELLADAGRSSLTTELMSERWSKLTVNCALNAAVGITGLGTNEVIRDAMSRRVGVHAAAEVIKVAAACGAEVADVMGIASGEFSDAAEGRNVEELEQRLLAHAERTQNTGIASLGQDVMKGRRTEIEFLNGYASERGREKGIPTPVNDALLAVVTSQPAGRFKPEPGLLQPIYDRLG